MADKITNDITLLFKTKLDEKSKQEVGKNLKSLLENAAIGFDEAETKRNLEPIVRMMQKLFNKAEIAFDADKLLSMPSRQALQEMAKMGAYTPDQIKAYAMANYDAKYVRASTDALGDYMEIYVEMV